MFVTTMRNALLVFALFLVFLGPAARPARAQIYTREQVRKLIKIRLRQVNIVADRIHKEQAFLAIYPSSTSSSLVQAALTQDSALLPQLQTQVILLVQLLANLDLDFAIDRKIQNLSNPSGGRRGDCDDDDDDRRRRSSQQNDLVRQAKIADLQTALSQVQANISNLQSQIVP